MMKRYVCCVLCGLLSLMVAGKARADWRVWTLTATKRVVRDAPAGAGTSVKLQAVSKLRFQLSVQQFAAYRIVLV